MGRVLLVDDSGTSRTLVRLVLEGSGHHLEALESLEAMEERLEVRPRPDIVLLDLHLGAALLTPGRVNLEGLRKGAVRFLLYSGTPRRELEEACRRLGADGWLSKSAGPQEILDALGSVESR